VLWRSVYQRWLPTQSNIYTQFKQTKQSLYIARFTKRITLAFTQMTLSLQLSSPLALYRKLEREEYRALHADTATCKADHFFNFCVTASSMRDYVLEHLNAVSQVEKQPYHQIWSQIPSLSSATEIANLSKHFTLRDKKTNQKTKLKTKSVRFNKSIFVEIYANKIGDIKLVKSLKPDVKITLSDGQVLGLYEFTRDVLNYWKDYLSTIGLNVRRQAFARLAGK
jgi:hypothetical protein